MTGGGYLIVKDTVALARRVHYETEDYIAFYREESEYLSLYSDFTLINQDYLSHYDATHQVGSIICIFHTK